MNRNLHRLLPMALLFCVGCPKTSVDVGTVESTGQSDAGGGAVDLGGVTASASTTSSGVVMDAGVAMDSDGTGGLDVELDAAGGIDVGTGDTSTRDGGVMAEDVGMTCSATQSCAPGTTCCSGLDPNCDGTKLPSGDGTSAGRFTASADDPTVTDTITGLVWQRDGVGARPGCAGGTTCTWDEAQAFCSGLSLGGDTDWRLPTVKELRSIVDFTQDPVALDPIAFPHTSWSYVFWTANPSAESVNNAWGVLFGNGSYSLFRRVDSYNVRCVRGSRCAPAARYVVLEGGLVRDAVTERVWQRDGAGPRTGCTGPEGGTCTWAEARSYCESLVLGGFDDFRLPTAKEMDSLVDFTVPPMGPTIDGAAFPNTPTDLETDMFWSSTLFQGHAWCTFFYNGDSLGYYLTDYGRVRCIR